MASFCLPITNGYCDCGWQERSVRRQLKLNTYSEAKCNNRSPIVLRPPTQKLKETTEAEFVPSPSHICNTYVMCIPYRSLSTRKSFV